MLAFTSRSMSQIASSECCQTQLTGHQKKGFLVYLFRIADKNSEILNNFQGCCAQNMECLELILRESN